MRMQKTNDRSLRENKMLNSPISRIIPEMAILIALRVLGQVRQAQQASLEQLQMPE